MNWLLTSLLIWPRVITKATFTVDVLISKIDESKVKLKSQCKVGNASTICLKCKQSFWMESNDSIFFVNRTNVLLTEPNDDQ